MDGLLNGKVSLKSIHVPDVCRGSVAACGPDTRVSSQYVTCCALALPPLFFDNMPQIEGLTTPHTPPKFNWNPKMAMINKNIIFQTLIVGLTC